MDWCVRLVEEQRSSYSSHFLTLTYADAPPDLVPKDLQDFKKRLRVFQDRKFDGLVPLRYYSVGEYGELFGRPHYHSIMFNMIPHTVEAVERIWGRGNVHVGTVTGASIGYVTAYSLNKYNSPGREKPFANMSKRPGLGSGYLTSGNIQFHKSTKESNVLRNGVTAHMPRYYRYRIFDDGERRSIRNSQLADMEVGYDRTIEKLKAFNSNPYFYYGERQRYANEVIGKNINYKF